MPPDRFPEHGRCPRCGSGTPITLTIGGSVFVCMSCGMLLKPEPVNTTVERRGEAR